VTAGRTFHDALKGSPTEPIFFGSPIPSDSGRLLAGYTDVRRTSKYWQVGYPPG